jgi:hypothetical protein
MVEQIDQVTGEHKMYDRACRQCDKHWDDRGPELQVDIRLFGNSDWFCSKECADAFKTKGALQAESGENT